MNKDDQVHLPVGVLKQSFNRSARSRDGSAWLPDGRIHED
jgi:hypothetical protein